MAYQQTNFLRRWYIKPYRPEYHRGFRLDLYDGGKVHYGGPQHEVRAVFYEVGNRVPIFNFTFGCSPMDAIDSRKCAESAVGWLSLRPGDTDSEFFESGGSWELMTADLGRALDFQQTHAETVSAWVRD